MGSKDDSGTPVWLGTAVRMARVFDVANGDDEMIKNICEMTKKNDDMTKHDILLPGASPLQTRDQEVISRHRSGWEWTKY